jgi:predicted nucleic acid-binding protein
LVDTGPLIALFDPRDHLHQRCRKVLKGIREPLQTTVPVLTEAFHILSPASYGSERLRDFIIKGGLSIWFLNRAAVDQAFDLMEEYSDHPMDLADASLVVAAQTLKTRKIFTMDRSDFETYRIKRGHRHYPVEIVS